MQCRQRRKTKNGEEEEEEKQIEKGERESLLVIHWHSSVFMSHVIHFSFDCEYRREKKETT
jgi:hypothetical protein